MKSQKENKSRNSNTFIRYSSLGFEMMAIIAGFTFLGFKIDDWMNNEFRGFTLGFVILSVVIALVYGTKNLLKKKNKTENRKQQ